MRGREGNCKLFIGCLPGCPQQLGWVGLKPGVGNAVWLSRVGGRRPVDAGVVMAASHGRHGEKWPPQSWRPRRSDERCGDPTGIFTTCHVSAPSFSCISSPPCLLLHLFSAGCSRMVFGKSCCTLRRECHLKQLSALLGLPVKVVMPCPPTLPLPQWFPGTLFWELVGQETGQKCAFVKQPTLIPLGDLRQ